MVKKKQVGKRVEGWKAKSWFKVYTPENLGKAYIGDTIANEAGGVVGRVMQTTLGEITNDFSKQNVKMRFRVANVAGDAAYTEFIGHEVTRDYLRSLVKRRTSRIDWTTLLSPPAASTWLIKLASLRLLSSLSASSWAFWSFSTLAPNS